MVSVAFFPLDALEGHQLALPEDRLLLKEYLAVNLTPSSFCRTGGETCGPVPQPASLPCPPDSSTISNPPISLISSILAPFCHSKSLNIETHISWDSYHMSMNFLTKTGGIAFTY